MLSDRFKKYKGKKESRKPQFNRFFKRLEDSRLIFNDEVFTLLPGKTRDGREGTELGCGTHARVKKIKDAKGHEFAVKTPLARPLRKKPSELTVRERRAEQERMEEIDLLEREFQFLEQLDDGRAPRFIVTDDNAYLIQAIVKGKPLCHNGEGCVVDLVQAVEGDEKKLPVLLVKLTAMVLKVVGLIEKFHAKEILHLDLVHANIMFDFDTFEGRVIDFGEAIFFKEYVGQKKTELQGEFPHRTLEHLKLTDYEGFFAEFCIDLQLIGCEVYLKSFIDLMNKLCDECIHSRKERKDAKNPQEVVKYVKDTLQEFIDQLCHTHGLKYPEVLFQQQSKPAALTSSLMDSESKIPTEQKNNESAVVHVKTMKDYFNDACQAFGNFCKEKWRKFCNLLSCCFSSAANDHALAASDQTAYVKLADSASGRSSSSHLGSLKQFCGSAVQSASKDVVVASAQVDQNNQAMGEQVADQQHQPVLRRMGSSC